MIILSYSSVVGHSWIYEMVSESFQTGPKKKSAVLLYTRFVIILFKIVP